MLCNFQFWTEMCIVFSRADIHEACDADDNIDAEVGNFPLQPVSIRAKQPLCCSIASLSYSNLRREFQISTVTVTYRSEIAEHFFDCVVRCKIFVVILQWSSIRTHNLHRDAAQDTKHKTKHEQLAVYYRFVRFFLVHLPKPMVFFPVIRGIGVKLQNKHDL